MLAYANVLSRTGVMMIVMVVISVSFAHAQIKTDKQQELQKLEQAAAVESEEAAWAAFRSLLADQDRIIKYLNNPQEKYDSEEWNGSAPQKRSCIRRGASCDGRLNDCCESSACRCNLWGTNCRCQRVGLIQRLGK